ncbi:premnaspirodiene oxygenase [Helianthus annuus]|nr:premnaspirodiene oxygenase [Helianthus annuus]
MKTNDLSLANRPKLLSAEIVGYNYTDVIFSPYGEYWRQMRKICILELLSAKKVGSFKSIRDQESWSLVECMVNKGPVTINLTEKIFSTINVIATRVAVGSRCKDHGMLVELIEQLVSLSGGFDVCDLFPSFKVLHLVTGMRGKLMRIHSKIDKMLDGIISDHQECRAGGGRTEQNEDLLDVLLRLKDDGGLQFPLTYDNIKAVILDMFAAGTDTASVIIEWAMFELMLNPRVMHKLQGEIRRVFQGKKKVYESDIEDLEYLSLVINETLRLHPPIPLIPRECREKCEIGGYNIPVNTKITINIWKIGRDPDYWNNPESFIPERFSESSIDFKGTYFEYLPFGAGRRICPGLTMGLAIVELVLTRLLYHFN